MADSSLDISEARRQFNSLDERLKKEHVIRITRHGKEAFAVVDIDYLKAVAETLDTLADPEATRMLQESIEDIRHGRVHEHEDVKRELL